VSTVKRYVST